MKEKIYNYLVAALYGVPSCNYCQHMDCSPNRSPCSRCEKGWSNYKLHKNYAADVRRMARNIVKIAKEQE